MNQSIELYSTLFYVCGRNAITHSLNSITFFASHFAHFVEHFGITQLFLILTLYVRTNRMRMQ